MNSRDHIRSLLEQAKRVLGIKDSVKLVLYPMKYKVASISLKTKTIRLNKNLVELFTDDELYYIFIHELIHLKLKSLNHGEEFYKLLYTMYPLERSMELENKIIKKSTKINMKTERWLT